MRSESPNAVHTQGEEISLPSLKTRVLKHLWVHILKPSHTSIIFSQYRNQSDHLCQFSARWLLISLKQQSNPYRGLQGPMCSSAPATSLTSPPTPLHIILSTLAPPASLLFLLPAWAFALAVPLPGMQILPDIQMALYLTLLRFLLNETIPEHSISNRHLTCTP